MTSSASATDTWGDDMNVYFASDLIAQIKATSARAEKEKLLEQLASTQIGKFILQWTYNPFVTYGLKPLKKGEDAKMNLPFKELYVRPLLEKLSSRELTGHAAEREVGETMNALDDIGANLLFLILSKDLKCGVGQNTLNRVIPGLIPSFAVQRASKYEPKRVKEGKVYRGEFKLDGQRNTFICKDGKGGFFTRSGKPVSKLDQLAVVLTHCVKYAASKSPDIRKLVGENIDIMLDGEAMMGLFKNTGKLRAKKDVSLEGVELHLYDILSFEDFNAPDTVGPTDEERRNLLTQFVALAKECLAPTEHADLVQIVPRFFLNNDEEVQELFERSQSITLAKYLARGDKNREKELLEETIDDATGKPKVLEGIIVKDPEAQYAKRKSFNWLKVKCEETEDLRITGAYIGTKYTELENTLGGIQVMNGDVPVNVGGGYAKDARDEIWALWQEDLANGTLEVTKVENGKKRFDYTANPGYTPKLVGRLLEVKYMEVTPDGSLRHPNAVRFRDDKDGEAA